MFISDKAGKVNMFSNTQSSLLQRSLRTASFWALGDCYIDAYL